MTRTSLNYQPELATRAITR